MYIGLNNGGNGHLIYKLSTNQILVTMKYQSIPVPEDLIEAIKEKDSFNNKIQIDHVNSEDSIVQDDNSNNNKDDGQAQSKDKNSSVDKSQDKLNNSQQLYNKKSNKLVDQEIQTIISKESSNSTIVSVSTRTRLTSTSTPLQDLFFTVSTQSHNYYFMSMLSLQRHLYDFVPIIVSTSISTSVST